MIVSYFGVVHLKIICFKFKKILFLDCNFVANKCKIELNKQKMPIKYIIY